MKSKIVTHSGKLVDLVDPDPSTICIEDIAVHLSRVNRFTGASRVPYSVAQHSLTVASCCSPRMEIHGLLHDAAEAYLGDVSTPLKLVLSDYGELEKRMMGAIYKAFDLSPASDCREVCSADRAAFLAEWDRLMPPVEHGVSELSGIWWSAMRETAGRETTWAINFADGEKAVGLFVHRFAEMLDCAHRFLDLREVAAAAGK